MKKTGSLVLAVILLSFFAITPLSVTPIQLMVVEWSAEQSNGRITLNAIPQGDNSGTNPDYALFTARRTTTASYWINPKNRYGFSSTAVITAITTSANTWDVETSFSVFSYRGTSGRSAGRLDGRNVVGWGSYQEPRVIAVTYIWYIGTTVVETDTRMNTAFTWSLNGEAGKMDVQNIMTHEFGHWFVLDDLYADADYWLTMYGYAAYGETHKRDLGLGDKMGLWAIYGS